MILDEIPLETWSPMTLKFIIIKHWLPIAVKSKHGPAMGRAQTALRTLLADEK